MTEIGIDLGTTNTVAAIKAKALPIENGDGLTLPSVVAYPPSGAVLVGEDARRRRPIDPKNTIVSAKRLIGRDWDARATQRYIERYPFDLVEKNGLAGYKTRAGVFTATEIGAEVLGAVAQKIDTDCAELTGVITVPSMFGASEREATRAAGRQIGLKEVVTLDEPVAAALGYLTLQSVDVRLAAVYDLGGGTFDLAVVDCSRRPIEVLAHGGDLHLGGDDIDRNIAQWVAERVLKKHRWDLTSDSAVFSRLVVECERAKCRLSAHGETRIDLTRVDPGAPVATAEVWLDREGVDRLVGDLVRQSFVLCDEVLRSAQLKPSAIEAVFVAGGATLLNGVREGVQAYFNRPVDYAFHPMHIVAIGASLAGDYLRSAA